MKVKELEVRMEDVEQNVARKQDQQNLMHEEITRLENNWRVTDDEVSRSREDNRDYLAKMIEALATKIGATPPLSPEQNSSQCDKTERQAEERRMEENEDDQGESLKTSKAKQPSASVILQKEAPKCHVEDIEG